MTIKFVRGNDHEVRFRFKTFTGKIEKMYLTVKCSKKYKRLQKTLGNGIELIEGWYVITFVPADTNGIDCSLDMIYDIEIIVGGKRKTIKKDKFILIEEVTSPEDEV